MHILEWLETVVPIQDFVVHAIEPASKRSRRGIEVVGCQKRLEALFNSDKEFQFASL